MAARRGGLARARILRRLIGSIDGAGVIVVFCLLMVLPSGVTRLAGPDAE